MKEILNKPNPTTTHDLRFALPSHINTNITKQGEKDIEPRTILRYYIIIDLNCFISELKCEKQYKWIRETIFFFIFRNVENVIVNSATFTFGPWPSIKFNFWPFVFKSLGTSVLNGSESEQKRLEDKHLVLHIHTHLNVKVFAIS